MTYPGRPKFCSYTCSNRAHRKFGKDNPSWKQSPKNATKAHPTVQHICAFCGKPFQSTKKYVTKYCSDTCRAQGYKRTYAGYTHKERLYHEGYILLYKPSHPRATRYGRVAEHILVWEQSHTEPLPKSYVIHHLNGVKDDNRLCNLVALPSRKHDNILNAKAKRIQELEALLRKQNQLI